MDNNELHYNDLRFRAKKDGDWIIPIEFINDEHWDSEIEDVFRDLS